MNRLAIILFVLCGAAMAQAPWPGQAGNPVGFSAYATLNGTACGAFSSGSSWLGRTVIANCTYGSAQSPNCHYCVFQNVHFTQSATKMVVSGSNVLFLGGCIESNVTADANVQVTGSNVYFVYTSLVPSSNCGVPPPGAAWPSAGAGLNTSTAVAGTNAIAQGSGYQYGINMTAGSGLYVTGMDMWGFANAMTLNQGAGAATIVNSWLHDARYPGTGGGADHTDGPGYLNGTAAPSNFTMQGNANCSIGNTQGIAFQGGTSGYAAMQINNNYLCGYGYTAALFPGGVGATNSFFHGNVLGTDLAEVSGPLYGSAANFGTGSAWGCNTISFLAGTTWSASLPWTPTSGMNGQYWVESTTPNSATDQGSNTHCGTLSASSVLWLPAATATKTITITAGSTGNLAISGITFGTGTQFSQANNCPATLVNGASCAITITYRPTGSGPVTDTLQITDSDPASPEIIPLLGIDAPSAPSTVCGPPTYPCSTTSQAVVQTPNVPPFVSSLPTATVNTSNSAIGPCSPSPSEGCMQATAGLFNTSWSSGIGAGNGGNITINGTKFGVLSWNSPTVATLMSNPGTLSGAAMVNYTACAGSCLNSIGYDISLNPFPLDPILRASDGNAVSGRTLSSTASGGDNDEGWNCAGRTDTSAACKNATLYLLAVQQGGCDYVEGLQFINGLPQVVAPFPSNSATGSFSPCGSLTWSHQNPMVGYFMGTVTAGSQVNDPVIYSITYSWSGIVGQSLTIGTPVAIYDIGLSGVLPNAQAYNAGWTGPLSEDINDQLFWIALSNVQSIKSSSSCTANLTNGSVSFTMAACTLPTDGSLVDAAVILGGVNNVYTIIANNAGGGTVAPSWGGANGTFSFVVNGGQGTGLHEFAVHGSWSGGVGTGTFTPAGAAVYNTYTGSVAASGTASGGTIDSSCRNAHIHDSFGFTGTAYVQISGASTGTNCGDTSIFWNALTNHIVPCTGQTTSSGPLCAGHNTFGRQYEVAVNNPNYYYFLPANAASLTAFPSFSNATGGCENHFTWRHANATDTNPVILASANNNYSTSALSSTWTVPYYNEIDALPVNGATPIRFAHSFILGPGNAAGCGTTNVGPFDAYFTAQNAIGITSQDGRLFEWSSSMLGNLGTDSAAATRADIFVIALDAAPSLSPTLGRSGVMLSALDFNDGESFHSVVPGHGPQ
jgi:hypothetical protein